MFSYVLGVLVLIFVLLRQIRVRPVPRVLRAAPAGRSSASSACSSWSSYAGDHHHIASSAWAWVARHAGGGRDRPGHAARPLDATVGEQRLGGPPGQRRDNGALAGVVGRALRRRAGPPAGSVEGELPAVPRPDARRAARTSCYRRARPLWAQLGPRRGPAAPHELHARDRVRSSPRSAPPGGPAGRRTGGRTRLRTTPT